MINRDALELIKEYEGVRLKAYPDPGSKNGLPWTIGYGHTKNVKKGDVITQEQAEAFLIEDLKIAEAVITKYVKVKLNENQYGALISFIHNLGEEQFTKGSVLKYINEGRLNEVVDRMSLYKMNDGKIMQGLIRRRKAEGDLWAKPVKKSSTLRPVTKDTTDQGVGSLNWLWPLLSLLFGLFNRGKK